MRAKKLANYIHSVPYIGEDGGKIGEVLNGILIDGLVVDGSTPS